MALLLPVPGISFPTPTPSRIGRIPTHRVFPSSSGGTHLPLARTAPTLRRCTTFGRIPFAGTGSLQGCIPAALLGRSPGVALALPADRSCTSPLGLPCHALAPCWVWFGSADDPPDSRLFGISLLAPRRRSLERQATATLEATATTRSRRIDVIDPRHKSSFRECERLQAAQATTSEKERIEFSRVSAKCADKVKF